MTIKKPNRWTLFTRALPPLGVEIEIRAFKSWAPERVILSHIDMSWAHILPYRQLYLSKAPGPRRLGESSCTGYKDSLCWRFIAGRVPSARLLLAGRRRLADRARRQAQAHQIAALKAHRSQLRRAAIQRREEAWPIFRIRRIACFRAGGSNYYHHADVQAPNRHEAIRAAREGRISNWRHIDTFDSSDTPYMEFEYLGRIDGEHAREVARAERKSPPTWGTQPLKPLPFRRYLANGRIFSARYPKGRVPAAV